MAQIAESAKPTYNLHLLLTHLSPFWRIYVSNDNAVFERVHECLCKRGGRGHKAEVSAGQIDHLEAQLPRQHLIRLVWKLVLRITSPGEHDPLGVRCQRS